MDHIPTIIQGLVNLLAIIIHGILLATVALLITLPKLIYQSIRTVSQHHNPINLLTKIVLAIGIAFTFSINTVFYLLVFLPVLAFGWIWSAFTMLSIRLEGRSILLKIPLFLGLAFALIVTSFSYVVFYWPVVGLERAWLWASSREEETQRMPVGVCDEVAQPGQTRAGRRNPTDNVSDLQLDVNTGEEVDRVVEDKSMATVIAEVKEWDDGASIAGIRA